MCGNIDDSGPNACGDGNCVDKVNGYMFNCDAGHELMLQENDSVCVAKECGTFLTLSLSLEHGSVEPAKMLFGDVGLVICLPGFTLSGGCEVRRGRRFCSWGGLSQCARHEVAVCLLKCREHHVLQKRCSSREMSVYTCDRGYVVGGSFSQVDVVCLQDLVVGFLLLNPPLVPMLLWCAECDVFL